jgi:hypothetical protein
MTPTSVQQPCTPSSAGYHPPLWGAAEKRVAGLGVEAGFWGPRIGICVGL